MLFRTIEGELIEINKYDFKNDKLYYEKIMNIKNSFTKTLEIKSYTLFVQKMTTSIFNFQNLMMHRG